MSVADEAKAAAEAEFPAPWDGRTGMRIPFAHGYQRGHAAGVHAGRDEVLDHIRQLGHGDLADLADAQLRVRDMLEQRS